MSKIKQSLWWLGFASIVISTTLDDNFKYVVMGLGIGLLIILLILDMVEGKPQMSEPVSKTHPHYTDMNIGGYSLSLQKDIVDEINQNPKFVVKTIQNGIISFHFSDVLDTKVIGKIIESHPDYKPLRQNQK